MSTDVSSICAWWNSENAMGSTPSRSTWLTWSTSMEPTAWYQSECMADIRRCSESRMSSWAMVKL